MIDKDRKFPESLENPIDNQIIYLGKYFYSVFKIPIWVSNMG